MKKNFQVPERIPLSALAPARRAAPLPGEAARGLTGSVTPHASGSRPAARYDHACGQESRYSEYPPNGRHVANVSQSVSHFLTTRGCSTKRMGMIALLVCSSAYDFPVSGFRSHVTFRQPLRAPHHGRAWHFTSLSVCGRSVFAHLLLPARILMIAPRKLPARRYRHPVRKPCSDIDERAHPGSR